MSSTTQTTESVHEIIRHLDDEICSQISTVLKGSVEISGPPMDYQEFFWRAACVVVYDMTRGYNVGKEFQYLLSSILYHRITSYSHIFQSYSSEIGNLIECTAPFEIKGYTEFAVVRKGFPKLNLKVQRTFRYIIKSGVQLRMDFNLKMQACTFMDQNRDYARMKGYNPLGAPSTSNYISFFNNLEDSISRSGRYNFIDICGFIAEDISALDSPTDDSDDLDNSFIKRLKSPLKFLLKQQDKTPDKKEKLNSLVIMSNPTKLGNTLIFDKEQAKNKGDKRIVESNKGLGWALSQYKMPKPKQ